MPSEYPMFIQPNERLVVLQKDPNAINRSLPFILLVIFVPIIGFCFTEVNTNGIAPYALVILVFFWLAYIRMQFRIAQTNARKFVIEIQNGTMHLNGVCFCLDKKNVVIEILESSGSEGIGQSYIIGVKCDKKFIPLHFYLSLEQANIISSQLAHFLSVPIQRKHAKAVSFFKGY